MVEASVCGENLCPPSGGMMEMSKRQSTLITMAEKVLHEYYTRLSDDPSTLSSLYLDQAEVIIAGRELNVDAELMTGKHEIEAFFSGPKASHFRGSKVVVDALHPLASPTAGVVLFSKGRVWLCTPDGSYAISSFYHFLCLAPRAKASLFSHPPEYLIANEYLHFANVGPLFPHFMPPQAAALHGASLHSAPLQNAPLQSASLHNVTLEKIPLDPEMHRPAAPQPRTSVREIPLENIPPQDDGLASSRSQTAQEAGRNPRNGLPRREEHCLHASVADPASVTGMSVEDLAGRLSVTAVTQAAVGAVGSNAKCLNVVRPRMMGEDPARAYFFLQFETAETMLALKELGRLTVAGIEVVLSPRRYKYPNNRHPGMYLHSRGGRGGYYRGGINSNRATRHE